MAIEFTVYHPKNYQLVADLSPYVVNHDFTAGLNGDFSGESMIEVTSSNKNLLLSMKENSHFLVVSAGTQRFGAVVNSTSIRHGVMTVNYVGFLDYMDKQNAEPAHKSGVSYFSKKVGENDRSWVKTFYADNGVGMLYSVLFNHSQVITAYGYTPSFSITNLASGISTVTTFPWRHTYRINALDLTTMRSAIESILNMDGTIMTADVSTSNNIFKWNIGYILSHRTIQIKKGSYFNEDVNEGESINRSASWAVGTDINGNEMIARYFGNSDVAFTTYNAEGKPEGHKDIQRYNISSAKKMVNSNQQVSFSMYADDVKIGDKATIDLGILGVYKVVVNEMSCSGERFDYTSQVIEVDSQTVINGIRKAVNPAKDWIFNPLNAAKKQSTAALRRIRRSTGVRS